MDEITLPGASATHRAVDTQPLLRSFWCAGFESACHVNSGRERLDMIVATQHDRFVDEDYGLLAHFNIKTVRDTARWHLIEKGGRYDFRSLEPMVRAAGRRDVQVIWNLCHYGWPDGLDPMSGGFVSRFARYSRAVARYLAEQSEEIPIYAPINEVSFLAWAAGELGIMHPFARGRDTELKRQLVRASIEAIEAIWSVDRRARIVQPEPLIHVIPSVHARPQHVAIAAARRESQFHAFDLLTGRSEPELGGQEKYLDVIGLNFYAANQWIQTETETPIAWHLRDPRWMPLHRLLQEVHERYERPMMIAETSHVGIGRGQWIGEIGQEVFEARRRGAPVLGVCLYPIIDRHDWENVCHWHHSGLWDLSPDERGVLRRVLNLDYVAHLRRTQRLLRAEGLGP